MRVCADGNRSNLVAAFEKVRLRQNGRPLQGLDDVDDKDSPTIIFELERNLSNESIGGAEVLEQVRDGQSHAMRPVSHPEVHMITKREAVPWALHLEVNVSSSETQGFERASGARDLDEVVSRNGALNTYGSPADLLGLWKRG